MHLGYIIKGNTHECCESNNFNLCEKYKGKRGIPLSESHKQMERKKINKLQTTN